MQRFVLVGHSLGGVVSIAYAGAHREQVAGLLLVGTPGKIPPSEAEQIMTALESDYEKVTEGYWNQLLSGAQPQVRAQIEGEMGSLPRKEAISIIKAIFQYNALPALGSYRGPKLAVITTHADTAHDLHKLVPDLPHKLITRTSHWPHMDKPEEFNRLLDEFLATAG